MSEARIRKAFGVPAHAPLPDRLEGFVDYRDRTEVTLLIEQLSDRKYSVTESPKPTSSGFSSKVTAIRYPHSSPVLP